MTKIGITGSTGKMGQMLIHEIYKNTHCELSAALIRQGNPLVGQDVGAASGLTPFGLDLSDDVSHAAGMCDVIIDFTRPEGTLELLKANQGTPMMIGTTGFDDAQRTQIIQAAGSVPIVLASNTSLGVAILRKICIQTAQALGPDYDIDILEMHHRDKVDAPSGTAVTLGEAVAHVPGFHLNHQTDRSGSRTKGAIEFSVSRGGGVIGDHHVVYAGEKEMITLSHRALDRSLFAQGALTAALWVKDRGPGLYSMDDVIEA